MANTIEPERNHTVVIGGGQAGLSVGYHLKQRGVRFVILDASPKIGDVWRARWDSLRVFSPAKFSGLDGLPFPAPRNSFPTKDQMADYLQFYAATFALPVLSGTRVDRVSRQGNRFLVVAGDRRFEADNVIVAMGNYQRPRTPPFARELDARVAQIHSLDYRNPSQFAKGPVLVVGAGNSGAEISLEAARTGHQTWLAGPDVGHVPFDIDGRMAALIGARIVLRVVFHRILSVDTPIGRRARPRMLHSAGPLVRTKPRDLVAAGVQRVPKVAGVQSGLPILEDGRVLDAATVVWCTGFNHGFSWIDLPIFDADGDPQHDRGIVTSQPGFFFVGLHFLYSLSSEMIHGVGRDAKRIANIVADRVQPNENVEPAMMQPALVASAGKR